MELGVDKESVKFKISINLKEIYTIKSDTGNETQKCLKDPRTDVASCLYNNYFCIAQ